MSEIVSIRFGKGVYGASCAAVADVMRLEHPADGMLSRFFREHPNVGQHDRGTVAETVYAILRRRRLLDFLWPGADVRELVLLAWAILLGANLRELEPIANEAQSKRLAEAKAAVRGELPFAVACDLPDWVISRLRLRRTEEEVRALANGLLVSAPLDLRVNLLKTTREEVLARLAADGFSVAPTPLSPAGVRLQGKPAINRHPLFVDGSVEVQDEGSQLLAYLVGARRGEMVVDFCAGAGGKTLALGMLMHSTGRLYAFDVSEKRLTNFKPRLARSGLSNVHPQRISSERDVRIGRLAGKIDRVLVDVPCSGLGTLRRNPDLKWRQVESAIEELCEKQRAILSGASRLVKPGGRLVYATCSLLDEENEGAVNGFLTAHPDFRRISATGALAKERIVVPGGEDLALVPHVHGTDGFYAAVLERVGK